MNSQATRNAEGVVGQHDQVHAGEIGREERQHPQRRGLVPAIAERVEACRGAAEIGDDEKECRQRIEAKMRADARQADRQRQRDRRHPPAIRCMSATIKPTSDAERLAP